MERKTPGKKQRGFFDLGISLIILAIGASTAAVKLSNTDETAVAQNETAITGQVVPHSE